MRLTDFNDNWLFEGDKVRLPHNTVDAAPAVSQGPTRASGAPCDCHCRQSQCHGAGHRQRRKFCCRTQPCRPVYRQRAGLGYRHCRALGRPRRCGIDDCRDRHRCRYCVSGTQSRPRSSDCGFRSHRQRIPAGHSGQRSELSAPQPHHQRIVAGRGCD